ncbi:copper amine oxidase domain protein [Desulforamulus reducens MI-1]|uniref:Copper amine oxidase domain protein n=1 Tax=Desulforamulus reducens (strain ATCC BAA-1160 / DSM 100696 / MI-1) TaxID=349161 RepID=A4J3D7_DESRM|nr:copper amine oxidase N-terminal domain-containing protein [Desulforamulus reducens]ABO49590.1 copper amine oxidase domain protein [Desulforamulus reducens MI-1]
MKKFIVLLLSLVMCFSFIIPAGAEELSQDKKALLDIMNKSFTEMNTEISSTATGSVEYKLNQLGGGFLMMVPELSKLQGAKLGFDYKLNAPAGQMAMQWKINYQGKSYQGDIYLAGSKVIFTKDVFKMVKEIDPTADIPDLNTLPQYLYVDEPELTQLWSSPWLGAKIKDILPLQNELMAFILEGMPNECISNSGNNLRISINQKQFAACLAGLVEKAESEPERFADLMAKYITSLDATQSYDEVKNDILTDIKSEDSEISSADNILKSMEEAGIELKNLDFDTPKGQNGSSKFILNLNIKDTNTASSIGEIKVTVDQVKSGNQIKGNMDFDVKFAVKEQNMNVSFKLAGDYDQSQRDAASDFTLTIDAAQGSTKMFNLGLDILSKAKVDKNVNPAVPQLTKENSLDFSQLTNESDVEEKNLLPGLEPKVNIVLDDIPVDFDVQPLVKDGRTMVPVRTLAEALGCRVNAVNDQEVYLAKGNQYVMMKLGERKYTVNGKTKLLDVPAYVKDGRTLVPLRFIAEELGCQVEADGNMVYITSNE